jgi:hypothetical protein
MKAGDKLECDDAGIASAVLILSASKISARLASQMTLCLFVCLFLGSKKEEQSSQYQDIRR